MSISSGFSMVGAPFSGQAAAGWIASCCLSKLPALIRSFIESNACIIARSSAESSSGCEEKDGLSMICGRSYLLSQRGQQRGYIEYRYIRVDPRNDPRVISKRQVSRSGTRSDLLILDRRRQTERGHQQAASATRR